MDCTACMGLEEVIGHCRDNRPGNYTTINNAYQDINCIYFGHKTTVELSDKQFNTGQGLNQKSAPFSPPEDSTKLQKLLLLSEI